MKKFLSLFLLIASISAFARLGETLEECTKRYGKPTVTFKIKKEGYLVIFTDKKYWIISSFHPVSGKCIIAQYLCVYKPTPSVNSLRMLKTISSEKTNKYITAPLSKKEKTDIMRLYAKDADWKHVPHTSGTKEGIFADHKDRSIKFTAMELYLDKDGFIKQQTTASYFCHMMRLNEEKKTLTP
jgi:hypothetical protein